MIVAGLTDGLCLLLQVRVAFIDEDGRIGWWEIWLAGVLAGGSIGLQVGEDISYRLRDERSFGE